MNLWQVVEFHSLNVCKDSNDILIFQVLQYWHAYACQYFYNKGETIWMLGMY